MGGPDFYQPTRSHEEFERPSSSNHVELPAPLDIPELAGSFSNEHEVTPTNSARGMHVRNTSSMDTTDEIDEMLRHPQLALVTSQTQNSDPLHYSPIDGARNNPFANSPASQGRGSMERSPVDYEGLAYNEASGSFDDMPPARQSAAAAAATQLVKDPTTGVPSGQKTPDFAITKKSYMQLVNHDDPAKGRSSQDDDWYGAPPQISDPVNRTASPSSGARNMLPSQVRRNSQFGQSQTDLSNPASNGRQGPPPLPAKFRHNSEDDDGWQRDALGYMGYAGQYGK
jgi:hypothetical protein